MLQVQDKIDKTSDDAAEVVANAEEAKEWEAELERLQALLPLEAEKESLQKSIAELEMRLSGIKSKLPQSAEAIDTVRLLNLRQFGSDEKAR